jgi:hypothetical protein
MRRNQHHLEEREEQTPPTRQYPTHHEYAGFRHPSFGSDEHRSNQHGGEVRNSPHHTMRSSGPVYMPPQSPMQAPQLMHTAVLPSPSSLDLSNPRSLPPTTTSLQDTAESAHLQHQASVKTLEFRTLQREYDSLLQRLKSQNTTCATLEKKFEASDVEVHALTDEKEKLQAHVTAMECQVEELQQSRDEARRQLVVNGAQYMRIMEMANRLQSQGAEDKKKWESERTELEQRISTLEEALVTGTEHPTPKSDAKNASPVPLVASSSSQAETINVLRAEVCRLRFRTQGLETALQTMQKESISIQTAAQQLAESGGKLEAMAQSAVGTGG